jgi:hypothetical protein
VQSFAPSGADVGDILSIEPNAVIAHEGRRMMRFEDGEYVGSGPLFSVHRESWMDDTDTALLLIMRDMPEIFCIKDVCLKYEQSMSDEEVNEDAAFAKWGPMLYNKFQKRGVIEKVAKARWRIVEKNKG